MHPDLPMYTFWDYKRNRWERDAGLRIDHLLLNPKAAKRLVEAGVDREVRGLEGASDHAPAWIVLREAAGSRRKPPPRSEKRARPKTGNVAHHAAPLARKPLLVIDGDSFAHRSYHALPKNILRKGRKPAGAILGFANMLLRLYREEQPRAVLVAWDTLEATTYRHEKFPAYQSGREFDDAVVEQLEVLPEFVAACGFQNAKEPGFEADDFLAAAAARKRRPGVSSSLLAATATPSNLPLTAPQSSIPSAPAKWRASVPTRFARDMASIPHKFRISSRCAAIPRTRSRAHPVSARSALPRCYGGMAASKQRSRPAGFRPRQKNLRLYRSIATMNKKAPLPNLRAKSRLGTRPLHGPVSGSYNNSPAGSKKLLQASPVHASARRGIGALRFGRFGMVSISNWPTENFRGLMTVARSGPSKQCVIVARPCSPTASIAEHVGK